MIHPLRAKILEALTGSTKSPVQLAGELNERLGNVSYHVRTLQRDGLIELTGTRAVRGTTEHFYTGRARVCECCGGRGMTQPG